MCRMMKMPKMILVLSYDVTLQREINPSIKIFSIQRFSSKPNYGTLITDTLSWRNVRMVGNTFQLRKKRKREKRILYAFTLSCSVHRYQRHLPHVLLCFLFPFQFSRKCCSGRRVLPLIRTISSSQRVCDQCFFFFPDRSIFISILSSFTPVIAKCIRARSTQ